MFAWHQEGQESFQGNNASKLGNLHLPKAGRMWLFPHHGLIFLDPTVLPIWILETLGGLYSLTWKLILLTSTTNLSMLTTTTTILFFNHSHLWLLPDSRGMKDSASFSWLGENTKDTLRSRFASRMFFPLPTEVVLTLEWSKPWRKLVSLSIWLAAPRLAPS